MGDSKKNIQNKSDSSSSGSNASKKHSHGGHRQRVRERYYENGFKGMPAHNILEMLLFFGIPRKDTNQLAHDLIEKFGSFSNVLEADRNDLMNIKGMTESAACLISMILPLYSSYTEDLHNKKAAPHDTKDIVDFLRPKFQAGGPIEKVFVLCYDLKGCLITCRQLNEGSVSSTSFDTRKLGQIVLETNCASVLIAHNHPHSIAVPSKHDIYSTTLIAEFLKMIKVDFRDHIIIADEDYFSMIEQPRTMHIIFGQINEQELATAKNFLSGNIY